MGRRPSHRAPQPRPVAPPPLLDPAAVRYWLLVAAVAVRRRRRRRPRRRPGRAGPARLGPDPHRSSSPTGPSSAATTSPAPSGPSAWPAGLVPGRRADRALPPGARAAGRARRRHADHRASLLDGADPADRGRPDAWPSRRPAPASRSTTGDRVDVWATGGPALVADGEPATRRVAAGPGWSAVTTGRRWSLAVAPGEVADAGRGRQPPPPSPSWRRTAREARQLPGDSAVSAGVDDVGGEQAEQQQAEADPVDHEDQHACARSGTAAARRWRRSPPRTTPRWPRSWDRPATPSPPPTSLQREQPRQHHGRDRQQEREAGRRLAGEARGTGRR